MRPAIDHHGRVWVGEMSRNCLAVFDPRTRQFQEMTPPNGKSGIMGVAIAADDTVWFAEQFANYIGHFVPVTGQFETYPLPTLTVPDPGRTGRTMTLPNAPNDLVFDARGTLWFTEMNADAIGQLDPRSGAIRHFHLPARKAGESLSPYGIAVDPEGTVWFTESATNRLGRLFPATGQISYFTMQAANARFMEIGNGPRGSIWATAFDSGLLVELDPNTGVFTPYYAPTTSGLYGLAITATGDVWVAITSDNVIARLDVPAHRFVYYAIPTSGSVPFGVAIGADETVWFTEAGSDKLGALTR